MIHKIFLMKNNILHLHLTRTGGKSICGAILRSKKYKYIQVSKFFSQNKLKVNTNQEKMDDLLNYLKSNNDFKKPLFITGHIDLNPYFYLNNYKIFTVLRNPLNRLRSHLNSILDYQDDPTYIEILNEFSNLNYFFEYPKESILKVYNSNLCSFNKESLLLSLNNGQSRQIANIPYFEKINDSDLLNKVLDNISRIEFICSSENLKFNYLKLKKVLDLPFYYHLPGINSSSPNRFSNCRINQEFFQINKVDYFLWKTISIFERNFNDNSMQLLNNFEGCDKFIFNSARKFKYKLLNLFDKLRDSFK